MMTKDECVKIAEKLMFIYKIKKENAIKYTTEIRNLEYTAILNVIDDFCKSSMYIPSIAELKSKVAEYQKIKNLNLNSCYWYINERIWCNKHNKPYYDIETGAPLPPYKTKTGEISR